jgi:RNA recognition motif-containing protein
MSSKIYVGNLPYTIDDASLRQNFSEFGGVLSAKVMMDRDTGRSKGFAFVEMSSAEEAQAAITGLNGMSVSGRSIVVNISKPKEPSTGYGSGYRDTRNLSVLVAHKKAAFERLFCGWLTGAFN